MSARATGGGPPSGSAVARWWINHPGLDYVVAAGVLAMAVVLRGGGHHPLRHLDGSGRLAWVAALTVSSAVVFGLLLATGCVVLAVAPGPRLARVMASVGDRLSRIVGACLASLALGTALLALGMPLYGPHPRRGIGLALLVVLTVMVQRVGRLLWVYWRVALVFIEDSAAPAATPPVAAAPRRPVKAVPTPVAAPAAVPTTPAAAAPGQPAASGPAGDPVVPPPIASGKGDDGPAAGTGVPAPVVGDVEVTRPARLRWVARKPS